MNTTDDHENIADMDTNLPIVVLGAGSIGCYIGGLLLERGLDVLFIGRKQIGKTISRHGLALTCQDDDSREVGGDKIRWHTSPEVMATPCVILLCTKSTATVEAARQILEHSHSEALVISLQNGVGNVSAAEKIIGDGRVLGGMVGFNIRRFDETPPRFHRATAGGIVMQDHAVTRWLADHLEAGGIDVRTLSDIRPVMWGKLLINLNNSVNVLSALPLKRQLSNRPYRKVFAACIAEAMKVLKGAGIKPEPIGNFNPAIMPTVLRLPDFIFKRVANSIIKMDDDARSSMAEDLQYGRAPEIDYLNGAICELGAASGIPTPANDVMVELVGKAFSQPDCLPFDGDYILRLIAEARGRAGN